MTTEPSPSGGTNIYSSVRVGGGERPIDPGRRPGCSPRSPANTRRFARSSGDDRCIRHSTTARAVAEGMQLAEYPTARQAKVTFRAATARRERVPQSSTTGAPIAVLADRPLYGSPRAHNARSGAVLASRSADWFESGTAVPTGFEPAASALTGRRANQTALRDRATRTVARRA